LIIQNNNTGPAWDVAYVTVAKHQGRARTEVSNIQNTNHQQMHKESFIINRNTLLHVWTLLGHLQGELFITVSGPDHGQFTPPKTTHCTVNSIFSLNCKVQT
jgi:hypothetical protein